MRLLEQRSASQATSKRQSGSWERSIQEKMSNALYDIYGKPTEYPWYPNLIQFTCTRPSREFLDLDKEFPIEPALYFLCANKGISYIGISGEKFKGGLFKRLRTHVRNNGRIPFHFCYAIGLPQDELNDWETEAIRFFQPEWNKSKRDYKLRNNDALSGLSMFLDKQKYFEKYANQKIFRIDTIAVNLIVEPES